jgi:hypothetical protein
VMKPISFPTLRKLFSSEQASAAAAKKVSSPGADSDDGSTAASLPGS